MVSEDKVGRLTSPALRRGLDILELFLSGVESVSVPYVAKELSMPRATAHELVNTLEDRGYLQRLESAGQTSKNEFVLGVKLLELARASSRNMSFLSSCIREGRNIVRGCGETVQIAVLDSLDAVYVGKVEGSRAVRLVSEIGSRLPAHCSAVGKALLAALPDVELDHLLNGVSSLTAVTSNTITDPWELRLKLREYRERGWASEYGESNNDVGCVAVPIFGRSEVALAAMSVAIPLSRWNDDYVHRVVDLVLEARDKVTKVLGGGRFEVTKETF